MILPGISFGGGPSLPPPLPPLPTRADPAIAESKRKLRLSALRRRGRGATILAGRSGGSQLGSGQVDQPQAGGARLGG